MISNFKKFNESIDFDLVFKKCYVKNNSFKHRDAIFQIFEEVGDSIPRTIDINDGFAILDGNSIYTCKDSFIFDNLRRLYISKGLVGDSGIKIVDCVIVEINLDLDEDEERFESPYLSTKIITKDVLDSDLEVGKMYFDEKIRKFEEQYESGKLFLTTLKRIHLIDSDILIYQHDRYIDKYAIIFM